MIGIRTKKKLTIAKWFAKHLLDAYYVHPSTTALKKRNYSLEFAPEPKGHAPVHLSVTDGLDSNQRSADTRLAVAQRSTRSGQ